MAPTTRRAKAKRIPSHSSEDNGTDASLLVTPIQIEQAPHLKLWKKWVAVRSNFSLQKLVPASKPLGSEPTRITDILSSAPLPNRKWVCQSVKEKPGDKLPRQYLEDTSYVKRDKVYWLLMLDNELAASKKRKAWDRGWVIEKGDQTTLQPHDQAQAEKFGDAFCRLLDRIPLTLDTRQKNNRTMHLLSSIAIVTASSGRNSITQSELSQTFTQEVWKGGGLDASPWAVTWRAGAYHAAYLSFGEDGHQHVSKENRRLRLEPGQVAENRAVPALPDTASALLPAVENAPTPAPSEAASHQRAIDLLRHVQYTMCGAVGSPEQVSRQAHSIVSLYLKSEKVSKRTWSSVYGGLKLFKTALGETAVYLTLTDPVKRDIQHDAGVKQSQKLEFPYIRVAGLSTARVATVLERMYEEFLGGANLLDMWQAGTLRADEVNNTPADRPFVHVCDHSETERRANVHVCQKCRELTFCDKLVFTADGSLRVCLGCDARGRDASFKAPSLRPPKPPKPPKAGATFETKVLKTLYTERSASLEDRKATAKHVTSKYLKKDGLIDAYFQNKLRAERIIDRTSTRPNPFTASPDAADILHVDDSGKTTIHHRDNIAATSYYANTGLYTWPKGVLSAVKDSIATHDLEDNAAADDILENVSNRLDHLWAIRCKYPHGKKERLAIQMDQHEYIRRRGEWRQSLLDQSGHHVDGYIPYVSISRPLWTKKDRGRILGLITQMQDRQIAAKTMPKGKDGSPFPFNAKHKPKGWSWEKLEAHMAYHFSKMDRWCDRKEETTDETPETLFLELVWQWIDNGGRCAFTHLPMTVYARHPAAFTIGHLHHGQAMRTRWSTREVITSIEQRDDARCNVLFETRIANYLKMDFAESDYPLILQDLLDYNDDCEWFSSPASPVPPITITEISGYVWQANLSHHWNRGDAGSTSNIEDGDEGCDSDDIIDDFDESGAEDVAEDEDEDTEDEDEDIEDEDEDTEDEDEE